MTTGDRAASERRRGPTHVVLVEGDRLCGDRDLRGEYHPVVTTAAGRGAADVDSPNARPLPVEPGGTAAARAGPATPDAGGGRIGNVALPRM